MNVSLSFFFFEERFSTQPAYLQKDFKIPFSQRFNYHIDREKNILSIEANHLVSVVEMDNIISTLTKICSTFKEGDLNLFVDHRNIKDSTVKWPFFHQKSQKNQ